MPQKRGRRRRTVTLRRSCRREEEGEGRRRSRTVAQRLEWRGIEEGAVSNFQWVYDYFRFLGFMIYHLGLGTYPVILVIFILYDFLKNFQWVKYGST